ncbi:MAG TPA: hypothetical protein VMQ81_04575 [Acidimicrobiia bacterium]|nr:hypothetical protein [Acidimicrobiia bacterium]
MTGTRASDLARADSGAPGATAAADGPGGGRITRLVERARRRPVVVATVVLFVLAVPLLLALGALRQPRWYPILDLAQTEIRVRDVGTTQSPLIGLPGRIGPFGEQGSHPGPLSFWALAPVYRLFGATSWALRVSSVALNLLAMGACLWIAYRRAGLRLMLGAGVGLAVLARAYGAFTIAEPWNPHLPLFFWMVVLLAVWSVVDDDLPVLPVAVVAASFCGQTHIPYLGLSVALVALAVGVAAVRVYRGPPDREARRRFTRWVLIAAGVGVVVWLPSVIDHFTANRSNFTVLWEHFSDPPEDPVGIGDGVRLLFVHLNPWTLLFDRVVTDTPQTTTNGSSLPGVLFLLVWLGSVAAAWRLRLRSLLRLDLVLGVALVLAAIAISRIFGFVWYYLMLWAWGITALMILATVWAVGALVSRRLDEPRRDRAATAVACTLAALVLVLSAGFSVDAADTELPTTRLSKTLGAVTEPTADALGDREPGRDGDYLVTWDDPIAIGSQGWGLMNELDRRGFQVFVPQHQRGGATRYQVIEPADATAEVHLVIGEGIDAWAAKPGVERVAYVEPRSRAERAEYDRLRTRVIVDLEDAGLTEAIPDVDSNLLGAARQAAGLADTERRIVRMLELGLPTAVFVGPPEA